MAAFTSYIVGHQMAPLALEFWPPNGAKGSDLFQRAGQTMKEAAGRGTSRYPNGIKR